MTGCGIEGLNICVIGVTEMVNMRPLNIFGGFDLHGRGLQGG